MRILFAGSPGIAVPSLEALFALAGDAGFELAGVLTNPDSPRGRSGKPEPTEVGAAAERFSERLAAAGKPPFPALKPARLDAAAREAVSALKPDLLVSFAYGRIFGPKFLALFPLGGINIHPSLLPRYRGATPIPAAILNRESLTGLSIQRLAAEMDSGDILAQENIPLNGRETAGSLGNIAAQKAAELLPRVLGALAAGTAEARPQNHGEATYCSLLSKEDGLIDWSRSAAEIEARVRAFDPWPQTWTTRGGRQLFILRAGLPDSPPAGASAADSGEAGFAAPSGVLAPGTVLGVDKRQGILIQTGRGVLAARELQYEAKKALDWKAFLNGARDFIGSRLGA
ncbi:MAG: methionyl-tRNA formyltransferase [Treponema sp.]|jgi:methionyl-tRNA formyltransferase|nr:methionyl-tRNA formyltransferase [Treponema sp.]